MATENTGSWSISGTTASYKVGSTVVAKITGLASGLAAADLNDSTNANFIEVTEGASGASGTITLPAGVLGTGAKMSLSGSGNYTLALDSTVTNQGSITPTALNKSSGKATVVGTIAAGYTLVDDNTIVYNASQKTGVTLATVSGLVSSIPDGAVTTATTGTVAAGAGVVTLSLAAFNKKKVTISSGYGYKLTLDTSDDGYTAATDTTKAHVGGVTEEAAWTVSGTTATYKQTKTAQYDLASDGKSVTYTAAKTATLATVKGLKKGLTVTSGAISGIDTTTTSGTFTLDSTVLGTTKVTLTNGKSLPDATTGATTASTYKLALATGTNAPATPTADTKVWTVSGTTATYKSVTTAGYTLDTATSPTFVTYTAQTAGTTLATVKGLAKGLTVGDDGVYSDSTRVVSINSTKNTQIDVAQGALTTTNVTLTLPTSSTTEYKLAFDGTVTAPTITPTWSVSGTTATLKGTVTAGYELATDGSKITYTKDSEGTKLATVKNLATGLTNTTIGNAISVSVDASTGNVKKTDGVATITLKKAALGTKDITLSGSGYKLALDSNDTSIVQATSGTDASGNTTYSAPTAVNAWRMDGATTAVYKSVTPAYYTPGDTKITYTAEDAAKTDAEKTAAVIATVTGLKSGLVANNYGVFATATAADAATDSTSAVVSISGTGETSSPYKVTLTAPALTTTNVGLTFGKDTTVGALYLYGTESSETDANLKVAGPTIGTTLAWHIGDDSDENQTVAELRSSSSKGWTLNSDSKGVTYAPASSDALLAKVTGLKAGLAEGTDTNAGKIGAMVNNVWTDYVSLAKDGSDKFTKEIVLAANAVGEQSIAVTGDYGYTFATVADLVLASNGTAPTATDMWVLGSTSGTAEYKEVTPKYFTYDRPTGATADDTTTLVYHAQTPSTDSTKLKATLTGLAEGLEVSADGQSIKDADNNVIAFNDMITTQIDVSKGALAEKNLVLENKNSSSYTLAEGTGIVNPEDTFTQSYDATAGTVTLKKGTTEGYALNTAATALEYKDFVASDSASAATVATITGLAKGLIEDDVKTYITHDETTPATPTIKIVDTDNDATNGVQNPVLGQSSIALASDTYTFDTFDTTNDDDTVGWKITGSSAYLYTQTPSSYTRKDDKTIEYKAPAMTTTTALAVVTGLNSSIATDADNQIEGVTVDPTSGSEKITLSLTALGGTSVYNTKADSTYEFAIDTDVPEPSDTTKTWSIASGTLIYKVSTPDSYTVSDDELSIDFTAAFDDVTTITGLKSTLNRSESTAAIDGITVSTSPVAGTAAVVDASTGEITTPAVDPTPGTIQLSASVLGKKDITLTNDENGDDYIIALAGDVTNKADVNAPVWNKTNKTTTATYTQTFAKGYTKTDDKHIVYASKNTKKTYATLTGLNKDVVANADGTINGLTLLAGVSALKTVTGSGLTATYTYDNTVAGIIVLSDPNLFTTTNITLGKSDNYALSVAADVAPDDAEAHWSLAKGTAKVVTGTTEGWQIKETTKSGTTTYDNKTIEYKKADETSQSAYTLATVTGLNTALELNDDGSIDGLEFDTTNYNITVSEDAVTTGTVKVAGGSYTLVMGDGIGAPVAEEPEWVVSKGTATYQYEISDGWNLSDDSKSMSYQAEKTDKTAVVLTTITGLNSSLEVAGNDIQVTDDAYVLNDDATAYVETGENGTIELSATALEGTKTVKFKDKNSVYQFKLADDVYAEGVANTNLTEDQNADEWKSQDVWVTNGTTANYLQNYDKEHYKFNSDGSIAVVAATKGTTVATITGIKKDATIEDQDGIITLDSTQLDGKTVKLTKGEGYALALSTSDPDVVESELINKKWKTTGNKAALTGTLTAGYKTSADGKTITYTAKDTANKAIATVSGIKSGVSIKDNVNDTVITLAKAQLDGKAVTVTNSMPEYEKYKLALGNDVAAPGIDATTIDWAVKGDTATLNGKVTAGYTVAPDAQSIAYTAATASNKVTTLATIKGINQSTDIAATLPDLLDGTASDGITAVTDIDNRTITLRNELLSNTVTVDGKNLFAFEFENDYSNKTVTGSTASDAITIAGTGVSVNAGKGNDVINFTSSDGGNTLVYASGDGDDKVTAFTDSDVIRSDKVVVTGDNIKTEGTNVLVTIGKNTITLQGYTASTLTITDKDGTKTYEQKQGYNPLWTESTSASDALLADNNYAMNAAALSDIVEPFKASYTPYDFDGGLDLVKKDSFAPAITYTGTDKK